MQVVLWFLPGYFWDGQNLRSTGACLNPTQHVNPKNGEVRYYVKPIGWNHSLFIRRQGIIDYIRNYHS